MKRVALVGVLVVLVGCVETDPGRVTSASTIRDCEVSGYGSFTTGESFSGSFSDLLGVETIDWLHDATGLSFETSFVRTGTDDVVCRQNGEDLGEVTGIGSGTVNGVPDYTYVLRVVDNRGATTFGSVGVAADATTDGAASLSGGELVTIPAEINVTAGDSSGAVVTLTLDAITCTYDEVGGTFAFTACSDASLAPGDQVAASALALHVDGGTCTGDGDDGDDGDDDDDGGCGHGHHGHGHGHHGHGRHGHGHGHHGHGGGDCECSSRGHSGHGWSHGRWSWSHVWWSWGHGRGHDCSCDDDDDDDDDDDTCVPLAVAVDLSTAIVPLGDPDFYSLRLGPAGSSTPTYEFTGLVFDGDIDVQFR